MCVNKKEVCEKCVPTYMRVIMEYVSLYTYIMTEKLYQNDKTT